MHTCLVIIVLFNALSGMTTISICILKNVRRGEQPNVVRCRCLRSTLWGEDVDTTSVDCINHLRYMNDNLYFRLSTLVISVGLGHLSIHETYLADEIYTLEGL